MSNSADGKMNLNEIIKKLKQGDNIPASDNEVNAFINNNLSENQADTVKSILSDEQRTKALLNSDAAKELFRKFFGGNGNG
jgi:hypothetical protein